MKNLLTLVVTLTFLAGSFGFALAQTPAPAPTEKKAAEKTADKPAEGKKMPVKNANGAVKSASADSVVVAGKQKDKEVEWTFALDPKTSIRKGGKSITGANLKPGDLVHVRYMEKDGKAMAQAITVKGGGVARKEMKEKAAEKPAEKK